MNIPVHEHFIRLYKNDCFWGNEAKIFVSFCFQIFSNVMEKETSTKFYGVLINFHEIMMKLQIFKFHVSDVIPMNIQNI